MEFAERIMETKKIKSVLNRNREDLAFFIGNGINHHFNSSVASWDDLLLDLWDKYSFTTKSHIPTGISLTEFYDVLEMHRSDSGSFKVELQKEVQELLDRWHCTNQQNVLINQIKERNSPILTSNFDALMPTSMELEFRKMQKASFSDFYPWSCYYSDTQLSSPTDGFGIWYVNGMAKYHRSIKLGLSHYMNNAAHAKGILSSKRGTKTQMDNPNWKGYHTWLSIFFNKSLFFFGLALDENEIFLRWLLIQRAKYFRKYPHAKKKGWFLMKKDGKAESDEGKKFFLQSVGMEVIVVDDYQTIYEEIWS